MDKHIRLPEIFDTSQLLVCLAGSRLSLSEPDVLAAYSHVQFDWRDVRYFQDIAFLRLLMLHIALRKKEIAVLHGGFSRMVGPLRHVIRQLSWIGVPELLSSGQMWGLQEALPEDFADLYQVDPAGGLDTDMSPAMQLVFCHAGGHYSRRSRELKRIAEFDGLSRRQQFVHDVEHSRQQWDLVASGEFRYLMLEQLRLNVRDHAHAALGLAGARIISSASLTSDWGLSPDQLGQVLRSDSQLRHCLEPQGVTAVLEISVIDTGRGIQQNLRNILLALHRDLGGPTDKRFVTECWQHIHAWPEPKQLLAFAFDQLGTSKHTRSRELKGLTTLRETYLRPGGSITLISSGHGLCIQAGGPPCGTTFDDLATWTNNGGTLVRLLVPLRSLPNSTHLASTDVHSTAVPLDLEYSTCVIFGVREKLEESRNVTSDLLSAFSATCRGVRASDKLLVVDWALFPYDKDSLSTILAGFAEAIDQSNKGMRPLPVAYVNFPEHQIGFISHARKQYIHLPPLPMVLDRSRDVMWLGLSVPSNEAHANKVIAIFSNILSASTAVSVLNDPSLSLELRAAVANHARRCPLFEEVPGDGGPTAGDALWTGHFRALWGLQVLLAVSFRSATTRLAKVLSKAPVRWEQPDSVHKHKREAIRLRSGKAVNVYFRCDTLVDDPFGEEIAEELISLSLLINKSEPERPITHVISCTSPTHWFVHRMSDGLKTAGVPVQHYVFKRRETIRDELVSTDIHAGDRVLIFTDVISTGGLLTEMAEAIRSLSADLAGAIALIDTRTAAEREQQLAEGGEPLKRYFPQHYYVLAYEPVDKLPGTVECGWYVDPETATPTRRRTGQPEGLEHFKFEALRGSGTQPKYHAYFRHERLLLNRLFARRAIRIGHFRHGHHHSDVLCNTRQVFEDRRMLVAAADELAHYIMKNHVGLVVIPNNSNAYILRDELALRFAPPYPPDSEQPLTGHPNARSSQHHYVVHFATACSVDITMTQRSYVATTLLREYGAQVRQTADVLILDDGACSGSTLRALVHQTVRAFSPSTGLVGGALPRVHIIVFVNRLPATDTVFWESLESQTDGRVRFVSLLSMSCKAYSPEECPQCKDSQFVLMISREHGASAYENVFYRDWYEDLRPRDAYEGRTDIGYADDLSTVECHELVALTIAMDRGHLELAVKAFDQATPRAQLLLARKMLDLRFGDIGRLLESLIATSAGKAGGPADRIQVVRVLILECRYHSLPPEAASRLSQALVRYYAQYVHERHLLGGMAAVLQALSLRVQDTSSATLESFRDSIDAALSTAGAVPDPVCRTSLSWLRSHLRCKEWGHVSVGHAVLRILECNRTVPQYHGSVRQSLQRATHSVLAKGSVTTDAEFGNVSHLVTWGIDVFGGLFDAARILGYRGGLSPIEFSQLMAYEAALHELRGCAVTLLDSSANVEARSAAVARCAALMQFLLVQWFGEARVLARLLKPFATSVTNAVTDATATFAACSYDADCVLVHGKLVRVAIGVALASEDAFVVCEPRYLLDAFVQLIGNAAKHCAGNALPTVTFDVEPMSRDRLRLLARYTGTSRLVSPPQYLYGLQAVSDDIAEYGGELSLIAEPHTTCTARLLMTAW